MAARVRTFPGAVDGLVSTVGARQLVEQTAKQIAEDASDMVPVDTGHLRDSYKSTKARLGAGGMTATAYTDSAIGHIVEWGSFDRTPIAPLRRAASRTRLRTRIAPKGEK
jgi:hypothetical protein